MTSASTLADGNDARAELVRSPFVSSWIGRARNGDLYDRDPVRRSAAWAKWAVESLVQASNGQRSYPALRLPGSFYDPQGTGPRIRPHLEIPQRVLRSADADFPVRLGQIGNGLSFPSWLYGEVTAVRRALFNTVDGPLGELCETLDTRRPALQAGLEQISGIAAPHWTDVAALFFHSEDGLSADATDDFSAEDVAAYFPAAADLQLQVIYDTALRDKSGTWASRRVGVWQIVGVTDCGDHFSLGVVTPRLTVNSLFGDPLFAADRESSAALLVRALLLRRIVARHFSGPGQPAAGEVVAAAATTTPTPRRTDSHLRAVVAQPGQKLPEASMKAATAFAAAYVNPEAAWNILTGWADKGYLLTVSREGFFAAHASVSRSINRGEDLDRDAIDVLLPLAWDVRRPGQNQVVRVTFTQRS